MATETGSRARGSGRRCCLGTYEQSKVRTRLAVAMENTRVVVVKEIVGEDVEVVETKTTLAGIRTRFSGVEAGCPNRWTMRDYPAIPPRPSIANSAHPTGLLTKTPAVDPVPTALGFRVPCATDYPKRQTITGTPMQVHSCSQKTMPAQQIAGARVSPLLITVSVPDTPCLPTIL